MFSLFLALAADLNSQNYVPSTLVAQTNNPCQDTEPVPAADTLRELELDQFGVAVMIPENYRAILRNDGSVQIVDPGTYNLIRCEAMGGNPLGRGFADLVIRGETAQPEQTLEAAVREDVYSRRPSTTPGPPNQCISPYPLGDKRGYLVQAPNQYHAEYWVEPNIGSDITVIETSCDCPGMVEWLITVLDRTTLLPEPQ
jgi:hypothetical protein